MPTILTNDLRSPEERRSDQLTILKRRQPPPRSAGRFFKILADTATAIGAFDPAFDSDADTEGPTSGSSIWRRELSRVRSTSSTSTGLIVDEKCLPSFETKVRQDSDLLEGKAVDGVGTRKESDDSFVFDGFVRDRATSFYGKGNDVEVVGEGMSPVSQKTLRQELEEDYDMFYQPKGKENAPPNENESTKDTSPVASAKPKKKKTNDSTRSEESDKATRSLESGVGSVADVESGQSESFRTLRQFRLLDDPDRFNVSIVSDENSDEELEEVSAMIPYRGGSIPLFVEEVGRVPRAAIIDGKVTRVRVSPDRGSFRENVSRVRRSSFGFGFGKDGWFRRKSVGGGRRGVRRGGWWRMKWFLFRNVSDVDARDSRDA